VTFHPIAIHQDTAVAYVTSSYILHHIIIR